MSQCSKIREAWANGDRLGALRITARFFDRSADTQIFKRGMDAHNIGFETENGGRTITGTTRRVHFFSRGELDKMTTAEVSDSLERVDNIINVLDEIMDIWMAFRPLKRRGYPASPKRCAPGAMSCRKPTKARKVTKMTSTPKKP
jgi:hypothetical protein